MSFHHCTRGEEIAKWRKEHPEEAKAQDKEYRLHEEDLKARAAAGEPDAVDALKARAFLTNWFKENVRVVDMSKPPPPLPPEKYSTRAPDCVCEWLICRCPVDYVVYYAQKASEWVVERTTDKQEMARGTLEAMMALVEGSNPKYPNGRRAHLSEDMGRHRFYIFELDYKDHLG